MSVKVNGELRWAQQVSRTDNAIKLFRVKMVEEIGDFYSYKGTAGIIVIRLIRSTSEELEFQDIAIRFSMKGPSDMTPQILIEPLVKKFQWYSNNYKIKVMDDGHAYFYYQGNAWDNVKYQIVFADYPTFVEALGEVVPGTEYADDVTNVVAVFTPNLSRVVTNTYASGVQSNGDATRRPFLASIDANAGYLYLQDWITCSSAKVVGDTLFTLSRGSHGKINTIIAYQSTGEEETIVPVKLEVSTTGVVTTKQDIPQWGKLYFNNRIQYRSIS